MTWTNSPYLKAVDERAEKAPLDLEPEDQWRQVYLNGGLASLVYDRQCKYVGSNHPHHAAALIRDAIQVAIRTDVPALSARVKEVEATLERLLDFVDQLCEDVGVSKHYYSAEMARAVLTTPPPEGDTP